MSGRRHQSPGPDAAIARPGQSSRSDTATATCEPVSSIAAAAMSGKQKTAQRSNLVKRACDACKIRKVKCSETAPCRGCVASGIACTFKRIQATRGPRSLRAKTMQKISAAQVADEEPRPAYSDRSDRSDRSPEEVRGPEQSPFALAEQPSASPSRDLLQALEIYRQRLYPVWPIVDVQELREGLAAGVPGLRLLATSIRLATLAQLRLEVLSPQDVPRTCLEDYDDDLGLNGLRVAFFLHIYHENQTPGGGKSLLYLRQAITIAQVMRLEREASYVGLSQVEQQMRRRILWLLFVTERGLAMLHKLPVVLKPAIVFPIPTGDSSDQAQVLPAFLKLVNLFWVFDQSGIFEILQNSDSDNSNMAATARGCLDLLQNSLQDSAADYEPSNDVQKADIFVTRQWMRAVLWRAAVRFGVGPIASSPIRIAKEYLQFMTKLPKAAIEAHGPTIEFKTYDIATAVIDAMSNNISVSPADHPEEVLMGLQRMLSSCRGGNKSLLSSLYFKMASIPPSPPPSLGVGSRVEEIHDGTTPQPGASPAGSCGFMSSSWSDLEEMLANTNAPKLPDPSSPNYHSLDQQNQQMSWPPLDFSTPLIRTPSPLARMFFDPGQGSEWP